MNKVKIILIILVVVLLVFAGVFWFIMQNADQEPVEVPNENQENATVPTNNNQAQIPQESQDEPQKDIYRPQISQEEKEKSQLKKIAASFAERYGSYSNQSDYENLEDLMPLMSNGMQAYTQNFVARKRAEGSNNNEVYFGVTTRALKTDILNFDAQAGLAEFMVNTQRNEVYGADLNNKTYFKKLRLKMVKEGGVWKVDQVNWQ